MPRSIRAIFTGWHITAATSALLAIFVMACLVTRPANAIENDTAAPKKALILYSFSDYVPWQQSIQKGIRDRRKALGDANDALIYEERFEGYRFNLEKLDSDWADFLRKKYAGIKFDVVISDSIYAGDFLNKHPELFADARRFTVNYLAHAANAAGLATVNVEESFDESIRSALHLYPKATKILSIGNASERRNARLRSAWADRFKDQVAFEEWANDFTFDELYQRVSTLPDTTIIFYNLVIKDSSGTFAIPYAVLKKMVEHAIAPIFVTHATLMGSGAVGGYVLSGEKVGAAIADLIAGAEASQFPAQSFSNYQYDAHALARWDIDEADLPADSIVLFKEIPLWQEYPRTALAISASILLLTSIVIALLFALRGRRKAINALSLAHAETERRVIERTTELATANAELARINIQDSLTQLANRRHFDTVFLNESKRHQRSGAPLSILMIDVDCFKSYNDHYGHVLGDKCLFEIAACIRDAVARSTDLAARYGGEEFVLILCDTDASGALAVAHHIRRIVEDKALPHAKSIVAPHVTLSIGVATLQVSDALTEAEAIQFADEQLYLAKAAGRNCVKAMDMFAKPLDDGYVGANI